MVAKNTSGSGYDHIFGPFYMQFSVVAHFAAFNFIFCNIISICNFPILLVVGHLKPEMNCTSTWSYME